MFLRPIAFDAAVVVVVIVADSEASNAVLRRYCTPAIEIERNILTAVRTVASYLMYAHTRAAAVRLSARTSARTRRRAPRESPGFRQSNDNDRYVEGNRLHAVKMRRETRNAEERSRFNASVEAEPENATHPFRRRGRWDPTGCWASRLGLMGASLAARRNYVFVRNFPS